MSLDFRTNIFVLLGTQLGGEVQVKNDELIYTHPETSSTRIETITRAAVANKTNNFMQNFCWETLRNLNGTHLQILRHNTKTAVWKRQNNRDYLVATRRNEMRALKGKLFPRKQSPGGSQKGSQRSGR